MHSAGVKLDQPRLPYQSLRLAGFGGSERRNDRRDQRLDGAKWTFDDNDDHDEVWHANESNFGKSDAQDKDQHHPRVYFPAHFEQVSLLCECHKYYESIVLQINECDSSR